MINLYAAEGRPEKREQFLKQPDMKQEFAESREKAKDKRLAWGYTQEFAVVEELT